MGLSHFGPVFEIPETIVPLLKNSWPKILLCMHAMHTLEDTSLEAYDQGEGSSVAELLSFAICGLFYKEDLGRFMSQDDDLHTLIAKLWLGDVAIQLATKALMDVLYFSPAVGQDRLMRVAGGSAENVTGIAFLHLRESLKQLPVNLSAVAQHIWLIITFITIDDVHPIGRFIIENRGAHILAKAFESVVRRPNTETFGSLGSCLEAFILIFRSLLVRESPNPNPHFEAVSGNIFQSLALCLPMLHELKPDIVLEAQSLISEIMPTSFVFRSVIVAAKSLGGMHDDLLLNVRQSVLGDSWMVFERLLLERLVCLRMSENTPDMMSCFSVSKFVLRICSF